MKEPVVNRCGLAVAVAAVALCALAATAVPGSAQEDGEGRFTPTFVQTKNVKLDELGNGRVSVTIEYKSDSLYRNVSKLAKKYKNFISRHYDRDDTLKVVKNFKQEIDDGNRRFILTYDSPGYAYNRLEYWSVGGLKTAKLVKKTGRTIEFKRDYEGRGDLTYYTNQPVRAVTKYTVPKGATGLRYNRDKGRFEYDLPPPSPVFFDENKSWLSVLFGVLAVLFAGLLLLVLVRTRRKPAVAGGPSGAVPAPKEEDEVPPRDSGRTCRKCGKVVPEGKRFCTGCGEPL